MSDPSTGIGGVTTGTGSALAPAQRIAPVTSAPASLAPAVSTPSTLDRYLDDASLVLSTIQGLAVLGGPGLMAGSALASRLFNLISAGVKAHESLTGQPLDMTKLRKIDLIS